MFTRSKSIVALALAGAIVTGSVWAAGNYSMYSIVGGAAICAGTVTGAGGLGGTTGQGQASTGSICPLSVPAGPTIVTGLELVPADTSLAGGASPQSVVLPMASFNALPIVFSNANSPAAANLLSATNLMGGLILIGQGNLSKLNISLPPTPIDGQQFAVGSNQTVAVVSIAASAPTTQSVANTPTVITPSTTGSFNYRFVWNAASSTWWRLQ